MAWRLNLRRWRFGQQAPPAGAGRHRPAGAVPNGTLMTLTSWPTACLNPLKILKSLYFSISVDQPLVRFRLALSGCEGMTREPRTPGKAGTGNGQMDARLVPAGMTRGGEGGAPLPVR